MSALIVRMGLRPVLWLLGIGWLMASALAWVVSVEFAHNRVRQTVAQEARQVELQADLASANLNQRLTQARSIAQTLSLDPGIVAALTRFGPAVTPSPLPQPQRGQVWQADPLLQPLSVRMMRAVQQFGINTLWVTNAAGDTIAEGHALGISPFIGTNYADRDYFKSAQNGTPGRQFAVGRATNVYGLYFSAPVQVDGQFMGMVGVGLLVPSFQGAIENMTAVVADDLGVIVLANDPALLMQRMPGAAVQTLTERQRDLRYKRQDFQAADISPAGAGDFASLYTRPAVGGDLVIKSSVTDDGSLQVHAIRDISATVSQSQRDQRWWFGLTSLLALAIAAQFIVVTHRQQTHLVELNEALAKEANTDALTGCANRRHFMRTLANERERSLRSGLDFCVLSMDIDHFKMVNDTYGHAGGDQVLTHFVHTIEAHLRHIDTLGRVGGEEFSILLPQTSAEGGAVMAERIRAAVEAAPAVWHAAPIPITVSIGGFQWSAAESPSIDQSLAGADAAMYQAKQGGRNRVVWASARTQPPTT